MKMNPNTANVFLSYTQEDEALLRELETHLTLLKRQELISTWYNRQVVPGTDWAEVIDEQLERASIILLLVSADFLASNYCYQVEMKRALERHEAGQAHVIPIIIRPCDWNSAPFVHLQGLPTDARPVTVWPNKDEAWSDVAAGIRRALKGEPLQLVGTPYATLPLIWNIPYPRNPIFTGREQQLTQLANALKPKEAIVFTQPQAIIGLGGIGKTQIAVEYAYRHRQDYQAVFWIRADTHESLVSGYTEITHLLNLPEKDEQDQQLIIKVVQAWLKRQNRWLLILDNADDLTLVRTFLPPAFGGHILLTTRAQSVGRLAARIEIGALDLEVGPLLLLRRASLIAPSASLDTALPSDLTLAKDIAEELGGLPLALDQAGAYIEETGCGLVDYQRLYQTRRTELLQSRGGFVDDHPESVATTWSLSFEQVARSNSAAADLLRLCAFLAPDAIPEELLTKGAKELGDVLTPVVADAYLLDQAIIVLRAYSLLTRDSRTRTLTIHRLVQAVLRDSMSEEIQQQWMQRVVYTVNEALPERNFANWSIYERYIPHLLLCATWIEQIHLKKPEAVDLLNSIGSYLYERGRYAGVEALYRQALAISEQASGSGNNDTAIILTHLGLLYVHQGRYTEAEPLYQRALLISEQQLGATHLNTVADRENLAILYEHQGKYAEAEPLLQRALAIKEQQLGATHPDTALSLNNLAGLYISQGKYAEAEPLLQRALAIWEQQLGATHPNTVQGLSNLAQFYNAQGKYVEAEPLFQRALAIWEQQLGGTHPGMASTLYNLANLFNAQGKYAEAEPLYRRTLTIYEQTLGEKHALTARSLWGLASLSSRQGHYQEADLLYKRALSIFEQTLGLEHSTTQTVREYYITLLQRMKRTKETK